MTDKDKVRGEDGRFRARTLTERLFSRVSNLGGQGCWTWTGSHNLGYGQIQAGARSSARVHRVAYEMLVGPIPNGLSLDHLCRNRSCVRPSHLEPVTNRVNVLRGAGLAAANAAKTHCIRGHEFTPENTYLTRKGRDCRICHTQFCREWRLKRKEARS
jgi:hypothetical protein